MRTSDYIASTVDRLPKGYVFTYVDFITEVNKKEAVIKTLNRMAAAGKITKLAKGRYYKPESSPFGDLQPTQYQVVKDLLEDDGKLTGYLTGYSIYNKLGLTTQVSNTIQIGRNEIRPTFKRERYLVSFIRQRNTITKENIPFLQLLDAMRYIAKIPDTTIAGSIRRFISIIEVFDDKEIASLVRLALKYPPAVRALLGAILEEINRTDVARTVKKSLNPITKYKLPGAASVLKAVQNWNII